MQMRFRNTDAVAATLAAGALPSAVVSSPVRVGYADDGSVTVVTPHDISAHRGKLRRLGVGARATPDTKTDIQLPNMLLVLPLQRGDAPADVPVLFEICDATAASDVIGELLRQGVDNAKIMQVSLPSGDVTLLLVHRPPQYTLLRAVLHDADADQTIRAYTEAASGLWIEYGWTHPLAAKFKSTTAGELVLLRADRGLAAYPAAFADLYSALDVVQTATCRVQAATLQRYAVPLRLRRHTRSRQPTLWVLRGSQVAAVDELVQTVSNAQLSALSVAAARDAGGEELVLVRYRAADADGQDVPLFDNTAAYAVYNNVQGLYTPVSHTIEPPLRRTEMKQALCPDASQLVWLDPDGEDGGFLRRSIPDQSFVPLSSWVDYICDKSAERLTAWMHASLFDFDVPRAAAPVNIATDTDKPVSTSRKRRTTSPPEAAPRTAATIRQPAVTVDEPRPHTEIENQLAQVVARFAARQSPNDSPETLADDWIEAAELLQQLSRVIPAGVCRAAAVWGRDDIATRAYAGVEPLRLDVVARGALSTADTQTVLTTLAAAAYPGASSALRDSISAQFAALSGWLAAQTDTVSIRQSWLAWLGLFRCSHNDTLLLTQARDRLLGSLAVRGLTPDRDAPYFLNHGSNTGLARDVSKLSALVDNLVVWVGANYIDPGKTVISPHVTVAATRLMLAGLAIRCQHGHLAEALSAEVESMRESIKDPQYDPTARWLIEALDWRLGTVREGNNHVPLDRQFTKRTAAEVRWANEAAMGALRYIRPGFVVSSFVKLPQLPQAPHIVDVEDTVAHADTPTLTAKFEEYITAFPTQSNPDSKLCTYTGLMHIALRLGESYALRALALQDEVWKQPLAVNGTWTPGLMHVELAVISQFSQQRLWPALFNRIQAYIKDYRAWKSVEFSASTLYTVAEWMCRSGLHEQLEQLTAYIADVLSQGTPAQPTPAAVRHFQMSVFVATQTARKDLTKARADYEKLWRDAAAELLRTESNAVHYHDMVSCWIRALPHMSYDDPIAEIVRVLGDKCPVGVRGTVYELQRLIVIEAVMQAVIGVNFMPIANCTRWMIEDEVAVRQRITRDMRAITQEGA